MKPCDVTSVTAKNIFLLRYRPTLESLITSTTPAVLLLPLNSPPRHPCQNIGKVVNGSTRETITCARWDMPFLSMCVMSLIDVTISRLRSSLYFILTRQLEGHKKFNVLTEKNAFHWIYLMSVSFLVMTRANFESEGPKLSVPYHWSRHSHASLGAAVMFLPRLSEDKRMIKEKAPGPNMCPISKISVEQSELLSLKIPSIEIWKLCLHLVPCSVRK